MKRFIVLLLALALTIGCTANPPAAGKGSALRKKPPALTVQVGEAEGAAALSTYSWSYPNDDGTYTGVEADGPHSLEMLDYVTPLPLGDEQVVTLVFDLGELTLDKMTLRRWDLSCAGDPTKYESDFELLPFTVDGDRIRVALTDGRGGVFEVHAYFQGEAQGDGYYTFCLEDGSPQEEAFSWEKVRIVWREGLAELPPTRIIRSRKELRDALATETALDGTLPDRDESFFTDHELVLVLLEEGSGSIGHEITDVQKTPDGLSVTIHRVVPEVCTADMAAWLLLMELSAGTAGDAVTLTIE